MSDAVSAIRTDSAIARRTRIVPIAPLRLASDQRLVEQVRAGSEQAFEALFQRYRQPVLAFCQGMLGSHAEAEDALQHTFLAAYRDLGRLDEPVELRAWLYAVARHRCLSVLRARRELPVDDVPEGATEHLGDAVARRDDLRAIAADVARLPDDQRVALVLAELGDVSYDEIARILGCRREKVKALVFQARASLATGRAARETPCAEIREQLATLRGGALRRRTLRRHLRDCPDCGAFRDELRAQRVVLPPVPSIAAIKRALGALVGSGGGGAGGAAVTSGAVSVGGLVATALVTVVVPAGGIVAAERLFGDTAAAPTRAGEAATHSQPELHAPPLLVGALADVGNPTRRSNTRVGSAPVVGGPQRERPSPPAANDSRPPAREPPQQGDQAASAAGGGEAAAVRPPEAPDQSAAKDQAGPGTSPERSDSPEAKTQVKPATREPPDASTPNVPAGPAPPEPVDPPTPKAHVAPASPAGPTDPAAKGPVAPASPGRASDPPGVNGQAAPTVSARPSDPLGANGRVAPAASGRPSGSSGAKGGVAPAKPPDSRGSTSGVAPAAPAKPPGVPGTMQQAAPLQSDNEARTSRAATPEAAPVLPASAESPSPVAGAPASSGDTNRRGNGHAPSSD